MRRRIDRPLLICVITLVVAGFFIFTSASLGLLAREGARFSSVAFNQLFFGIFLGAIAMLITSRIHYRFWRRAALPFFLVSVVLTLLVFVPALGIEFGGARRWLAIGSFSFQPAEFLKLGFIVFLAERLSKARERQLSLSSLVPFFLAIAAVGMLLLLQPDTGTFLVIFVAGVAMLFAAGTPLKFVALLGTLAAGGVGVLALLRPYVMERLLTFFNPTLDPLGTSYQIQQSLIAIGSGQWFGRGFGQSIQKFNYLPEPVGDSIFAVFAEEFGFIGGLLLIGLFLFFAFRGLSIARKAPDSFGGLLAVGIVILIVFQSFINISSMLGVLPLTGLPLLFVSHGGSALLFSLAEVGILLNISRYQTV